MILEPGGPSRSPSHSQSLYRKYRPRSFAADELVGQEHIARTLRNAIAMDRVVHGYLFCGPRGTGKTSTARLLAKAVNCLDPDPDRRPCNACEACLAINSGAAVDIIEIDAASNRGVDDIRDLREKVKYAPTQLRTKFYIIDEAHQLTRDAFNAFLKTLEEPPAHVKFVLATTEPDKLPETVASRCQRFDFRRIPRSSVVDRLRTVCELEGLEAEPDALDLIAQQSTGSLRDALGLLEQLALSGVSASGQPLITAEAVRRMLGLSRNERLIGLVDALADRDAGAGLRLIAEASDNGEDIHQLTRQFVGYLRLLLHLQAGGRDAEADDLARTQAQRFSLAELAALVRAFSTIDPALNRGSFAQLPLEIAFVESIVGPLAGGAAPAVSAEPANARRITSPVDAPLGDPLRAVPPSPRVTAEPVVRAPSRPRTSQAEPEPASTSSTTEVEPPRPPVGAVSSANGPLLEQLVARWVQIRRDVKSANSRIAALLGSADPIAIRDEEIMLTTPYEFHRNKLNEDAVRRVVEDVIGRHMGTGFRVTCFTPEEAQTLVSPVMGGSQTERPAEVPSAPETLAPSEDPIESDDEQRLRAAKSIFGAWEIDA